MNYLKEPERVTPVLREYQTVVAGGGIAGISAALAAARNGAKTLLIEREFMLGGLATAGLV
ncbi:MAG: FAD-dependent oxidoreductase, partial [Acutalibacteraceae bacterium]|nr:FAD-dependent oxidoreductase [Acutalibacteraceae bacterium]